MIKVDKKNEGTQVSDVSTGRPADNSITVKEKRKGIKLNESSDGTQVEGTLTPNQNEQSDGVTGVTNPENPEPQTPYPTHDPSEDQQDYEPLVPPIKDDSKKFTDQKYMDILNMLKANGYPNARFFGTEGYLMPDPETDNPILVRLVCRTISEGFKVNVLGGLYDMATSAVCSSQLATALNLAQKLNEILLSDMPDVNEMIDGQVLGGDPLYD